MNSRARNPRLVPRSKIFTFSSRLHENVHQAFHQITIALQVINYELPLLYMVHKIGTSLPDCQVEGNGCSLIDQWGQRIPLD